MTGGNMKRPSVIPRDIELHAEAAKHASEVADPGRRRALKIMAAAAALAGTGCSQRPPEKIMPYVNMPEGMVPGDPVFYASTLLRGGYGVGVLVETESGRPIKIEGNSAHPASMGAADAQTQAAVLTLWDPERSRGITNSQQLSTWPELLEALAQVRQEQANSGGAGLRLLTGPVSSPTLLGQIGSILAAFPAARWHVHDPSDSGPRAAAMQRVFGQPARTVYRLDQARVVLSVDAELFGPGSDGVRNAHDFMQARKQTARARMYALESTPGLCGALADSRLAVSPADMERMLETIVLRLEAANANEERQDPHGDAPSAAGTADAAAPKADANGAHERSEAKPGTMQASSRASSWTDGVLKQLLEARDRSVVAPGASLSERAHLLAWRINMLLGNIGKTVFALPQETPPQAEARTGFAGGNQGRGHPAGLAELVSAMNDGAVDALVMLDMNPVYDTPGVLAFSQALGKVRHSFHMGLYRDETARRATWHMPMTHELEAWSDARSHDGTASIVQPVIAPLYGGRSPHVFMNVLGTGQTRSAHDCVRATWKSIWKNESNEAFESQWHAALRRGIVEPAPVLQSLVPVDAAFATGQLEVATAAAQRTPLVAVFANDSNLVAGQFANNAWLQELPRPYSKITWDNAALISPATAHGHDLQQGDIVSLSSEGGQVRLLAPVWIMGGQADGVVTLALGYGRPHAGSVALGHGYDAYVLQDVRDGAPQRTRAVSILATGEHHDFSRTQHEMSLHGRRPVRVADIRGNADGASAAKTPKPESAEPTPTDVQMREHQARRPAASLYGKHEYESYAWGMTVDLDACIGCNACTIACQAENNIPVVGPEQVSLGREMHWIRVDLYREETGSRTQFQPMACQQCENAPCEVVCPVGATMHDSEGLNVQVYNRCVGTRFCSNNCPYKVRHFNFFQYSQTDPSAAAHANPDVTVRQRGVMEKCTYCVQRISHARIQAQKAGRPMQDGEVVTACEATCPTGAIVFGNINDPASRVSRSRDTPRNYAVLEELNTRPRTSYLARLDDAAAHLEGDDG